MGFEIQTGQRKWFAYYDGFVLPSIWEGLPGTLLEAMSVGCIPICTPVGGIPSVIHHGKDGYISKSVATKDYISILKEVIELPKESMMAIRTNAIKTFIQSYSIELTATRYLDAYRKVLKDA